MNSTFVQLLKDPGASFLDAGDGVCEMLGSLDDELIMLRKMNTVHQYYRFGTHAISHGTEELHDILTEGYGIESTEVTQMITNFIKRLFSSVYNLIGKIVSTITNIFVKIFHIDRRIRDNAEACYEDFNELFRKSSSDQKKEATAFFRSQLISQMCTRTEFRAIIDAYDRSTKLLLTQAHSEIKRRIRELTTHQTSENPWMTSAVTTDLSILGITIKKTSSAYASPFQKNEETTLDALQFHSLDDIGDINRMYDAAMWGRYRDLKKLVDNLGEYQKDLKRSEQELLRDGSINKEIVVTNITDIQDQIAMVLAIFAGLRQINTTVNFRRKRITEIGVKALRHAKSESGKGA